MEEQVQITKEKKARLEQEAQLRRGEIAEARKEVMTLEQEGAGCWIRVLEEEMMGKQLALGDVKAFLGKIIGMEKMQLEVLEAANLQPDQMATPVVDGHPIDRWRIQIWDALRRTFPVQPNAALREGKAMTEEESPATYVAAQMRKWRNPQSQYCSGRPSVLECQPQ
ncbi:hypothetical protein AAFF_G00320870 [Aldrovandia affinis]|uniref:Uncharacterized protein n=1 Tax=Aldrovandia affinis TaxID=143900 RepID=A0AAD7R6V4_9TELE|nr:hypothetical protein AAFF_G00320870 [Aldrovandia affinis]